MRACCTSGGSRGAPASARWRPRPRPGSARGCPSRTSRARSRRRRTRSRSARCRPAVRPAAAPHATISRRRAGSRRTSRPNSEPPSAASCTIAPSRPIEPPVAIVSSDDVPRSRLCATGTCPRPTDAACIVVVRRVVAAAFGLSLRDPEHGAGDDAAERRDRDAPGERQVFGHRDEAAAVTAHQELGRHRSPRGSRRWRGRRRCRSRPPAAA